jgi:hypothetical protein
MPLPDAPGLRSKKSPQPTSKPIAPSPGFQSLFKSILGGTSDPSQFKKVASQTFVMKVDTPDDPPEKTLQNSSDTSRSVDKPTHQDDSLKQPGSEGFVKQVSEMLSNFIPDAVFTLPNIQQTIQLLKQHLVQLVDKKESHFSAKKYLFKVPGQLDMPMELSVQKQEGKVVIGLYASGDLKELLLSNVQALIDHLKKQSIDVAAIQIHELNNQGDQGSPQEQNNSDSDTSSSSPEGEDEFLV